jgi:MSHA pilin protein MshC
MAEHGAYPATQRAFTLVELVTVMILIGILAVVAMPRFADQNAFAAAGFADELTAALKHARKSAVAMRRNVCVRLADNALTFTRKLADGAAGGCDLTPLPLPGKSDHVLDATTSGVALTATATGVIFSPLGRAIDNTGSALPALSPNTWALRFSVAASDNSVSYVVVEADSGYVH